MKLHLLTIILPQTLLHIDHSKEPRIQTAESTPLRHHSAIALLIIKDDQSCGLNKLQIHEMDLPQTLLLQAKDLVRGG